MDCRGFMSDGITIAGRPVLRDLISLLKQRFGGLRAAARVLEVDHQKLEYYEKKGAKMQEFLEFLEESRVKLKLSKTGMWDLVIPEREDK